MRPDDNTELFVDMTLVMVVSLVAALLVRVDPFLPATWLTASMIMTRPRDFFPVGT